MEMMIFMDPPEHTRYRRLVSKAFTPRRMKTLEEDIRTLCAGLLDDLVGRSSFDYVQDFGARVPAYVIAALLGVPPEDRDKVRGWIDEIVPPRPGDRACTTTCRRRRCSNFMEYLAATLTDRQKNPRDDMFTDLVNGEIVDEDGEPRRLTIEQAVNFAAAHRQRRHRDRRPPARLGGADPRPTIRTSGPSWRPTSRPDPERGRGAAPLRGAVTGAEPLVHGRRRGARPGTIPANSKVVMITGSAGRDERAYPDADRFDIHRKIDHHLSFGYGIHFCLGAALARTEGRIALEETLQAFPGVVGRHGRGGAPLHQHGAGLHEAADRRLTCPSGPPGSLERVRYTG